MNQSIEKKFDFSLSPLENFNTLFDLAVNLKILEPNAMSLATVDSQGKPSVRTVLFKGFIRDYFSFYTNYNGRKAKDIDANNQIAATFFWPLLETQVRIEGVVTKATREESEAYFKTRPRVSQIGAWASNQSEVIPNQEYFANKIKEYEKKFDGQVIDCPPNWGGFLIQPREIEFWFGKVGRLHERYIYFSNHQQLLISSPNWERALKSP